MARKLSATPRNDQAPAPQGHNLRDVEEADRVQLISLIARLSATEGPIEEATAVLKAARKARSQIIGLAKHAGFPAWEMEARLHEMKRGSREMAEIAVREGKQRKWLGILDEEQTELMLGDKVPPEAKDEAHWKSEGYKAGLRQMSSTAPTECPAMHTQAYMKAHERGLKEVLTANVPGKDRLSVRDQAAQDFKADHPEPEPGSPEAKAAERKAVAAAKASLEKLGGTDAQVEAAQAASRKLAEEEPAFEMTEEERAAQASRPSTQEVEEEGAVV